MSSTTIEHQRHAQSVDRTRNGRARNGFEWYATILGIVVGLLGAVLCSGGLYLIMLGGSWYYAITGALLIWAGVLMYLNRRGGAWLYGLIWFGTLIWAVWEVTLDGWQPASDWWALVPRVVAPTVILLLVAIALPGLRRGWYFGRAAIIAASLGLMPGLMGVHPAQAQDAAAPDQVQTDATQPPATTQGTNAAQTDFNGVAVSPAVAESKDRAVDVMPPVGEDWPAYGGSEAAQRYSPLDQIDTTNVSKLEKVWSFHTGDLPTDKTKGKYSPENTPIKIGDTLFVCSPMNQIIALDAATGLERWRFDAKVSPDAIPYGATCKGLAWHARPDADRNALCERA